MRLSITKSPNAISYYVIKDYYNNGKRTTKIVEKLGTDIELRKKLNDADPVKWAKQYIAELNRLEKEGQELIVTKDFHPAKQIPKDNQTFFNGAYLFLQQIYHELGIDKICKDIATRHKFSFDLDSILSRLIYSRIIFPSSKLATCQLSERFIEQPNFKLHHIYRALEVIAKECDFIQSQIYKYSQRISKRNTGILYYDCTNYFFEIEQEDGIKQYGYSKEHRPNPIVQMGLFMDGDGIPLAFNINKGNTNEQITLKPLESKILADFGLSKFVVCTDAGLASTANRKFNDKAQRAFITTQSVKQLKKHLKDWALDPDGWRIIGGTKAKYNIAQLDDFIEDSNPKDDDNIRNKIFYKERWIKENDLEQRLIVTFSLKYQQYHRMIRAGHIERANKLIDTKPQKLGKSTQNDYKRLIAKTHCTTDGEIAVKTSLHIDTGLIAKEESFDGFYGICTNLEDDVADIVKINHRRWEIEECFRIMKTEFKARPVYLNKDERIEAHFATCFLALIIFRFLEKKLNHQYTCTNIISGLKDMNFYELKGEGYIPTYNRTDFTDDLHDAFGFRTDYQIVTTKQMKKIFKDTVK